MVFIKQRPYDVIANPNKTPKASSFHLLTRLLWLPVMIMLLVDKWQIFKGVDVLAKIAKVHLGIRHGKETPLTLLKMLKLLNMTVLTPLEMLVFKLTIQILLTKMRWFGPSIPRMCFLSVVFSIKLL